MELYEFASRIGGLITYVMIEALPPKSQNRFSNLTEQQAREFAITWVENSIKSRPIFTEFRHLIIGPLHGNVSRSFELPEAQFKRLQEALSNIYPNIFDELEQTRKQLPDYVEYYRELVRRASVKSDLGFLMTPAAYSIL